MSTVREISLKVVDVKKGGKQVEVCIDRQTHRNNEFSPGSAGSGDNVFLAPNGFTLQSEDCPEMQNNLLYVRGRMSGDDKQAFIVNYPSEYNSLLSAVNDYNLFHKGMAKISKYAGMFAGVHRTGGVVKRVPSITPPPPVRKRFTGGGKRTTGWDKKFSL